MSTLHKVFVILVSVVSFVQTGVIATLFAHLTDWKDKFTKEANYHYQTLNTKNAEIAATELEKTNVLTYLSVLKERNTAYAAELASSNTKNLTLQRQLDDSTRQLTKMQSEKDVIARQLEIQVSQIKESMGKLEEFRRKLTEMSSVNTSAVANLNYERQKAERLEKDIAELETNHVKLAQDHQRLQETIEQLSARGVNTSTLPKKAVSGKVTAVAKDIGLIIISVGKDDDVLGGDEFTVYRGGQFVAKVVIDTVDRKWASGRVTLKTGVDPEVGDDVSNHIFAGGQSSGMKN